MASRSWPGHPQPYQKDANEIIQRLASSALTACGGDYELQQPSGGWNRYIIRQIFHPLACRNPVPKDFPMLLQCLEDGSAWFTR